MKCGLICLLLGVLGWCQAPDSKSTPAAKQALEVAAPDAAANPIGNQTTPEIAPDAAVITINGLCDRKGTNHTGSQCTTVITRAEFERTANALQPGMPAADRQQFANYYARALIVAGRAHEMGLDQGWEFEQHMKIARIQVLSEQLIWALQEKNEVSAKDIEDYYRTHSADFEVAEVMRLFIPGVQQLTGSQQETSQAEDQERQRKAQKTMKEAADTLHARAVAGEDFDKLQQEAFRLAGIRVASHTSLQKVLRNSLPSDQASVMDLKPGETSAIFSDQSGYLIYKLSKKDTQPLEAVREEIRDKLRAQRVEESLQAIQNSAAPALEESYFGP